MLPTCFRTTVCTSSRFTSCVLISQTTSLAPALAAVLVATTALAGPSWDLDLTDDAKQGANSAQVVSTSGVVTTITGSLGSSPLLGAPDLVDMFLIRIANPTSLKLSTAGGQFGGSAEFNSQLYLFRADGILGSLKAFGLLSNNDAESENTGSLLRNFANDGSGFVLDTPGLYFVAISAYGAFPTTNLGDPIWGQLAPGVVGFGQQRELIDWSTPQQSAGGIYSIRLDGVTGVPSPGALALLGLSGLIGRRRSR